MKKALIIILFLTSLGAHAQRGFEIKLGGGITFLGIDPWIRGGIISATALYNVNGILAIGPTFSTTTGAKFYIFESANQYPATVSELGLVAQFTILRAGKFKMYVNGNIANVKGKTGPIPNFIEPTSSTTINIDDSAISFGVGVGTVLNLGKGFYFNILEYEMRTLSSDFMDMDKGYQGTIGPMHTFRTGFAYTFN